MPLVWGVFPQGRLAFASEIDSGLWIFPLPRPAGLALSGRYNRPSVKVLALDYGSARTGVAVSDPTATVARPLGVVERAGSDDGLARVVDLARGEAVERIVVGLPVTLRGELGAQAAETERFVAALRAAADVPVETFDERFTTRLAQDSAAAGGRAGEDALAAAHLLTTYLEWLSARTT